MFEGTLIENYPKLLLEAYKCQPDEEIIAQVINLELKNIETLSDTDPLKEQRTQFATLFFHIIDNILILEKYRTKLLNSTNDDDKSLAILKKLIEKKSLKTQQIFDFLQTTNPDTFVYEFIFPKLMFLQRISEIDCTAMQANYSQAVSMLVELQRKFFEYQHHCEKQLTRYQDPFIKKLLQNGASFNHITREVKKAPGIELYQIHFKFSELTYKLLLSADIKPARWMQLRECLQYCYPMPLSTQANRVSEMTPGKQKQLAIDNSYLNFSNNRTPEQFITDYSRLLRYENRSVLHAILLSKINSSMMKWFKQKPLLEQETDLYLQTMKQTLSVLSINTPSKFNHLRARNHFFADQYLSSVVAAMTTVFRLPDNAPLYFVDIWFSSLVMKKDEFDFNLKSFNLNKEHVYNDIVMILVSTINIRATLFIEQLRIDNFANEETAQKQWTDTLSVINALIKQFPERKEDLAMIADALLYLHILVEVNDAKDNENKEYHSFIETVLTSQKQALDNIDRTNISDGSVKSVLAVVDFKHNKNVEQLMTVLISQLQQPISSMTICMMEFVEKHIPDLQACSQNFRNECQQVFSDFFQQLFAQEWYEKKFLRTVMNDSLNLVCEEGYKEKLEKYIQQQKSTINDLKEMAFDAAITDKMATLLDARQTYSKFVSDLNELVIKNKYDKNSMEILEKSILSLQNKLDQHQPIKEIATLTPRVLVHISIAKVVLAQLKSPHHALDAVVQAQRLLFKVKREAKPQPDLLELHHQEQLALAKITRTTLAEDLRAMSDPGGYLSFSSIEAMLKLFQQRVAQLMLTTQDNKQYIKLLSFVICHISTVPHPDHNQFKIKPVANDNNSLKHLSEKGIDSFSKIMMLHITKYLADSLEPNLKEKTQQVLVNTFEELQIAITAIDMQYMLAFKDDFADKLQALSQLFKCLYQYLSHKWGLAEKPVVFTADLSVLEKIIQNLSTQQRQQLQTIIELVRCERLHDKHTLLDNLSDKEMLIAVPRQLEKKQVNGVIDILEVIGKRAKKTQSTMYTRLSRLMLETNQHRASANASRKIDKSDKARMLTLYHTLSKPYDALPTISEASFKSADEFASEFEDAPTKNTKKKNKKNNHSNTVDNQNKSKKKKKALKVKPETNDSVEKKEHNLLQQTLSELQNTDSESTKSLDDTASNVVINQTDEQLQTQTSIKATQKIAPFMGSKQDYPKDIQLLVEESEIKNIELLDITFKFDDCVMKFLRFLDSQKIDHTVIGGFVRDELTNHFHRSSIIPNDVDIKLYTSMDKLKELVTLYKSKHTEIAVNDYSNSKNPHFVLYLENEMKVDLNISNGKLCIGELKKEAKARDCPRNACYYFRQADNQGMVVDFFNGINNIKEHKLMHLTKNFNPNRILRFYRQKQKLCRIFGEDNISTVEDQVIKSKEYWQEQLASQAEDKKAVYSEFVKHFLSDSAIEAHKNWCKHGLYSLFQAQQLNQDEMDAFKGLMKCICQLIDDMKEVIPYKSDFKDYYQALLLFGLMSGRETGNGTFLQCYHLIPYSNAIFTHLAKLRDAVKNDQQTNKTPLQRLELGVIEWLKLCKTEAKAEQLKARELVSLIDDLLENNKGQWQQSLNN